MHHSELMVSEYLFSRLKGIGADHLLFLIRIIPIHKFKEVLEDEGPTAKRLDAIRTEKQKCI